MSARCGRALPVLRIEAASCYGAAATMFANLARKIPILAFCRAKLNVFVKPYGRAAERSDVCPCPRRENSRKTPPLVAYCPHRSSETEVCCSFAAHHFQNPPTFCEKWGRNGEKLPTFLRNYGGFLWRPCLSVSALRISR